MDPDSNLKSQRILAETILANIDAGQQPAEEHVDRLCHLVQSLDEWITKGGFLPKDWQHQPRKKK